MNPYAIIFGISIPLTMLFYKSKKKYLSNYSEINIITEYEYVHLWKEFE